MLADIPPDIISDLKKQRIDLIRSGTESSMNDLTVHPAVGASPSKVGNTEKVCFLDNKNDPDHTETDKMPSSSIRQLSSMYKSVDKKNNGNSVIDTYNQVGDKDLSDGEANANISNKRTCESTKDVDSDLIRGRNTQHEHVGFLSPSQVDENILSELPSDIRVEIQTAMNKKRSKMPLRSSESKGSVAFEAGSNSPCSETVTTSTKGKTDLITPNKPNTNNCENLFSPSQIDLDVLGALPLDIQHEVNLALRFENKRRDRIKQRELRRKQVEELNRKEDAEAQKQDNEQHEEPEEPTVDILFS